MAHKEKKTRFAPKLGIKKGDRVKVIAGNDKGEIGEVTEVFPDKNRAIVEGVNMKKKHRKPTQEQAGGIIDIPASIHISNLMLVDPKTGDATRIGRKLVDGKLVRYAKKSGELIK
jgi:large subunit ribosomal protein L24